MHQFVRHDLQSDDDACTGQPDRPQMVAALMLKPGKGVLHKSPLPGQAMIALLLTLVQRVAGLSLAMQARSVARLAQGFLAPFLGIAAIGIHRSAGIAPIQ